MWCSLKKYVPNVFEIFFLKYVRFNKTSDVPGSMSGDRRNHTGVLSGNKDTKQFYLMGR